MTSIMACGTQPQFSGRIEWKLNNDSETDALEGCSYRRFLRRVEKELKPKTVLTLTGGYEDNPMATTPGDAFSLTLTKVDRAEGPDPTNIFRQAFVGPSYNKPASMNWAQSLWNSWVTLPRFFNAVIAKAKYEEGRPKPWPRPGSIATDEPHGIIRGTD